MRVHRYSDLENTLITHMSRALDSVTDEVFDELYKYIDEQIYKLGVLKIEPSLESFGYEQTGDFLRALKRTAVIDTSKGVLKTTIYFDYGAMRARERSSFYNAHMSLDGTITYNGKSVASQLPNWLDLGIDSPTFMHTGIGFGEFIEKYLNQNFTRLMKQELKNLR